MKKIIVTLSLAVCAAVSSQAQGLVIFGSSTQNMSTNGVTSGRIALPNQYYFALYYSVGQAASVNGTQSTAIQGLNSNYAFNDGANWTLYSGLGTNTAVAGRFANSTPNADGSATINGVAAGNSATFVVIGWSANLGNSIAALQAAMQTEGTSGYVGQSVVSGPIATGNGGLLPTPNLFGSAAPNIQAFTLGSFTVAAVPEPSTLVLAGLGGLSLLAFRRKK